MPIYEYTCSGCGERFELLVRSSTVAECPHCHSHRLERELSAFAVGSTPARKGGDTACSSCGNAPGSCMMD